MQFIMKNKDNPYYNLVLEMFRRENDSNINGYENIIEELVGSGSVVTTATSRRIWTGGVGNFVNYEVFAKGHDLYELTFDFDKFLTSAIFKEFLEYKHETLNVKITDSYKELNALREEKKLILDFKN